jgi:hypothetical protein
MSAVTLTEIERRLDDLSLDEQLRLLERLAARVRRQAADRTNGGDAELAAMAADPEIQRELRAIEEEFRVAEVDGLETSG